MKYCIFNLILSLLVFYSCYSSKKIEDKNGVEQYSDIEIILKDIDKLGRLEAHKKHANFIINEELTCDKDEKYDYYSSMLRAKNFKDDKALCTYISLIEQEKRIIMRGQFIHFIKQGENLDELKSKAELVLDLHINGEDFVVLAKRYSQHSIVDPGWLLKGQLYPEIENAMITHLKGDTYVVVHKLGISIIKQTHDTKERNYIKYYSIKEKDCKEVNI